MIIINFKIIDTIDFILIFILEYLFRNEKSQEVKITKKNHCPNIFQYWLTVKLKKQTLDESNIGLTS